MSIHCMNDKAEFKKKLHRIFRRTLTSQQNNERKKHIGPDTLSTTAKVFAIFTQAPPNKTSIEFFSIVPQQAWRFVRVQPDGLPIFKVLRRVLVREGDGGEAVGVREEVLVDQKVQGALLVATDV